MNFMTREKQNIYKYNKGVKEGKICNFLKQIRKLLFFILNNTTFQHFGVKFESIF